MGDKTILKQIFAEGERLCPICKGEPLDLEVEDLRDRLKECEKE